MTTIHGRTGIASGTHRRGWASAPRMALGGAFVAILLGVVYATGEWAHVVASLAAFATAITLIAAAVISWERVVLTAESAGLVELSHSAAEPRCLTAAAVSPSRARSQQADLTDDDRSTIGHDNAEKPMRMGT